MTGVRMIFAGVMLAASAAPLASAAGPTEWLVRCSHPLGGDNDPENGKYMFQTDGLAKGAQGRGAMDFTAQGSRTNVIYPTEAKDLMNPYGSASLSVGYYGPVGSAPPHAMAPVVGHVSMGAIARDFMPIPGDVTMKLVIDGQAFGPYAPGADSVKSSGQYSVWLDTADYDGDSKPPRLKPAEFAALAKAVQTMKQAEVVLVRGGVDLVRMPVVVTKLAAWRDGLPKWAAETRARITDATICGPGDNTVN
jgi:hypothetical protein